MNTLQSNGGRPFELSGWRDSIQKRREIIRLMVLRSAVDGERLDTVLDEFKRSVGWSKIDDRDRNLLNVVFHDVRSIAWNWHLIPSKDRDAFADAKITPSTLAKQARALLAEHLK